MSYEAKMQEMKEHYEEAGRSYEKANNAPDARTRQAYQEHGDEAYGKGAKAAEEAKKEVRNEWCKEFSDCEKKSEEAYKKGDMKAAKEYRQKAEKAMEEGEKKEKQIDNQQKEHSQEARKKMDGLEKTRY